VRLWHRALLPFLPQGQLLSQKREVDLMFRDYLEGRKTNHILINYVWEYDISHLISYYVLLEEEFKRRGYTFNKKTLSKVLVKSGNFVEYTSEPFPYHHNGRYLIQNFFNLEEKFDRGQKDFSVVNYMDLYRFVNEKTNFNVVEEDKLK
jgi:uncharacterized protein (TIGR02328 family)